MMGYLGKAKETLEKQKPLVKKKKKKLSIFIFKA